MTDQKTHPADPPEPDLFYREIREELDNILGFWKQFSIDAVHGGFVGKMDSRNRIVPDAPKGVVLNARILWTFSAAYDFTADPAHLALAAKAFDYIRDFFTDPVNGGLYWSVNAEGKPLDTHKQIYAQAFGIYGMSEYYRVSGSEEALMLAIGWYRLIEQYSLDTANGGYVDAFAENWSFLQDKRLSAKDQNAVKTMNTHLHLVEAYANLYAWWPDPLLRIRVLELLAIFQEKMLDTDSYHLQLFFDERWNPESGVISYGHDIEAGWLLQSCAESAGDPSWIVRTRTNALRITDAAMEGLDEDGGLWCERDRKSGRLVKEKHWWPQAEALIGLCNAWQHSGNPHYETAMLKNWAFIRKYLLDREQGEWFWGITADGSVMRAEDKIGLWKCPYHNSRACIQLLKRRTAFQEFDRLGSVGI